MRPARRTDKYAPLVVPKVGWGPNTPFHLLSLHGLLRESFAFSGIIYYQIITYRMCHNRVLREE
jgi:hypothetical protein